MAINRIVCPITGKKSFTTERVTRPNYDVIRKNDESAKRVASLSRTVTNRSHETHTSIETQIDRSIKKYGAPCQPTDGDVKGFVKLPCPTYAAGKANLKHKSHEELKRLSVTTHNANVPVQNANASRRQYANNPYKGKI
jgi:hypothetical protein